jgi:hypothetical protein
MHEFMSYEIFLASSFEDQIIDREKADVMSLALTVLNMASLDPIGSLNAMPSCEICRIRSS